MLVLILALLPLYPPLRSLSKETKILQTMLSCSSLTLNAKTLSRKIILKNYGPNMKNNKNLKPWESEYWAKPLNKKKQYKNQPH